MLMKQDYEIDQILINKVTKQSTILGYVFIGCFVTQTQ